jgi:hypothetical protein
LIASTTLGEVGGLQFGAVSPASWLGLGWLVLTAVGGFTAYGFLAKGIAGHRLNRVW